MLNILWPILIIISYIFAIITGNIENINSAIFEYTKKATDLCIILLGTICLWNGIMEICVNTSLINILTKLLNPFINFLFKQNKNDENIKKEISMNIIANMLGLGNAATPRGIRAMEKMQLKNSNKEKLTDDMATLLILNTASIQLIPTTVIAIRIALGSKNPTSVIIPIWISTICAAIVGILVTKICIKLSKRGNR